MVESLISILAFSVLTIYILLAEWKRQKLDFLAIFSAFYLIGYLLAPLHILVGGPAFLSPNEVNVASTYQIGTLWSAIAIWLFYFLVRFAYLRTQSQLSSWGWNDTITIPHTFFTVVWSFSIFISLISIYIYGSQFGSVIEAVAQAPAIRSGDVEGGSLVFFKQFIPFAFVAFLISYGFVLDQETRSIKTIGMLLLSAPLCILGIALLAGRIPALVVVGVCYLTVAVHHQRLYIIPLLLLGGFGTTFIVLSDILFHFFILGPETALQMLSEINFFSAYTKVWSQFAHLYISLEVAIANPQYSPRYLYDWVYGALHLLPERVVGISAPGTISHLNTYLFLGEYTSIVIPGIVTLFWYSGTWIGVAVGAIAYGIIGAILEQWLSQFRKRPLLLVLYFTLAFIWGFQFVRAGDPRILFRGEFVWFLVFGSLALYTAFFSNPQNRKKMTNISH